MEELQNAIAEMQETSKKFDMEMESISAFSKALKSKPHNTILQKIMHKICNIFTLGFPKYSSQIESFGEAPNCIPLFHMKCKWCSYKWNEGL